jgi:hypothetical protein
MGDSVRNGDVIRPPHDCWPGTRLAVTETALAFVEDARRRGERCQPLDWLPEVHHPIGNDKAVIPDTLLYYPLGDRSCCGRSWKSTGPPWAVK